MKICKKCLIEKELFYFSKDKGLKDGLKNSCKKCCKIMYDKYYETNREKEIERQVNYQKNNNLSVKIKRNIRVKKKYDTDILYRLKVNTRNRIKLFLKSTNFNKIKNGTFNIVGCTPTELKTQQVERIYQL